MHQLFPYLSKRFIMKLWKELNQISLVYFFELRIFKLYNSYINVFLFTSIEQNFNIYPFTKILFWINLQNSGIFYGNKVEYYNTRINNTSLLSKDNFIDKNCLVYINKTQYIIFWIQILSLLYNFPFWNTSNSSQINSNFDVTLKNISTIAKYCEYFLVSIKILYVCHPISLWNTA